jgi:hypothetical protein
MAIHFATSGSLHLPGRPARYVVHANRELSLSEMCAVVRAGHHEAEVSVLDDGTTLAIARGKHTPAEMRALAGK